MNWGSSPISLVPDGCHAGSMSAVLTPSNITRPAPRAEERPLDAALADRARAEGYTPLQADLIARRLTARDVGADDSLRDHVSPGLQHLDRPDGLPDLARAATRIADAIERGETIAVVSDHDVDGVSAHGLVLAAMADHFGCPPSQTQSWVSHRLTEGYGVSDGLTDRILAAPVRPALVITVDQGSSDEPRIARLRAAGIETCVTDHHLMPEGGVPSAVACVNPVRSDSRYPDRSIAGAYVAFLVMTAVRSELIARGRRISERPFAELLDYAALATIADAVSLARSRNNRAVVLAGLRRMNAGSRPCWEALARVSRCTELRSTDLGFGLGPRCNAGGRVDDAMPGVHLLRTRDIDEAHRLALVLDRANEERKSIERRLLESSFDAAAQAVAVGRAGLVLNLADGHAGVHGIVSSRVVDAFGRPTVCLSPYASDPALLTGSVRTVSGFHVRDALARIATRQPGLLVSFGGHAGAGGLKIARDRVDELADAFDREAKAALRDNDLGPCVRHDGPGPARLDEQLLDEIDALEPFGREWERPTFVDPFTVVDARCVGDGTHLKLSLERRGALYPAIWFGANRAPPPRRTQLVLAYGLLRNARSGRLELQVTHDLSQGP